MPETKDIEKMSDEELEEYVIEVYTKAMKEDLKRDAALMASLIMVVHEHDKEKDA